MQSSTRRTEEAAIAETAEQVRLEGRRRPGWGALLAALGCLTIAGTLINAYQLASPFALAYSSWAAGIVFYAGLSTIGIMAGIALLISAHACFAAPHRSRLKLWAKLVMVGGLMLSLSFPLMAYGTLLFRAMVGNEPIGSYEYPNVCDSSLLVLAVQAMVVPIVLGLVAIGVAVVWGRRKLPPDMLDVFN